MRLHGKTPLAAFEALGHPPRFPPGDVAPMAPMARREVGRYNLVRFTRGERRRDVFGDVPHAPGSRVALCR